MRTAVAPITPSCNTNGALVALPRSLRGAHGAPYKKVLVQHPLMVHSWLLSLVYRLNLELAD